MPRIFAVSLILLSCLAANTTAETTTAETTTAEPPAPTVATFHDGVQRVAIDAELLGDYLAHKKASPTADPTPYLEPLASLLRLQAEARRDPTPRLDFELRIAEERLLAADYRDRMLADVKVAEKAVQKRLEQRRQEMGLRRPKKVHLQNLFKRLPRDADQEARSALRRQVDDVRQQLLDGADFATLARQESDSQTARGGGRMGVVRPGDLPKPLESIAFKLAEGEVSEVIENDQGFLLLRCLKIVAEREIPVEEATQLIRQELQKQATEERLEQMSHEVLEAAAAVLDLKAARTDTKQAVAARFGGGLLTGQEVAWLSRRQTGAPALETLHESQVRELLERHIVQSEWARRARGSMSPELRLRLRWKAIETAASVGLRRRVQAGFMPPNEAEVRAYFQEHPDRFMRREHYQLQVLRLDSDVAIPHQAGRQIASLARQLESGAIELAQAARRHSDHWSAKDGGHVGWWSRKHLASHGPFVMRAVTALEPGETTQPIRQDQSWWIVRLQGIQPRRPLTFEEARVRADRLLGNERLADVQRRVEERVAEQIELQVILSESRTGES